MFRNPFKAKSASKYPIGLGVPILPKSIYQGKQPITGKEFKVLVNEFFAPKIKSLGFKGRDFYFYRINGTLLNRFSFGLIKLEEQFRLT